MKTHNYIFVGGLQRSGTTLLGRLLAGSPDVAGLERTPTDEDEGQFVQDVYPDDHLMGMQVNGGRQKGRTVHWAYHPMAHLTEEDAREILDPRARLERSWAPYLSNAAAATVVEKSPSNVMKTRFLQEVFPEAKFVIMTRHPISQALAVRKWCRFSQRVGLQLDQMVDHWMRAMSAFELDRAHLKAVRVVRYEDLVRYPARTMQGLCEFLGIEEVPENTTVSQERNSVYTDYWSWMTTGEPRFQPLVPARSLQGRVAREAEHVLARLDGPRVLKRCRDNHEFQANLYGYSFSSPRKDDEG